MIVHHCVYRSCFHCTIGRGFFFASLIIAERNNCMNGNCEMRYIFQFSFSWWVSSMFAMFVVRCGEEDADQVGRETIFSAVCIMHIMQLIDLNSWYDIRWMTHIGAVFSPYIPIQVQSGQWKYWMTILFLSWSASSGTFCNLFRWFSQSQPCMLWMLRWKLQNLGLLRTTESCSMLTPKSHMINGKAKWTKWDTMLKVERFFNQPSEPNF